MGDQRRPLQPGDSAPAFALAAANREGVVTLDGLHGRPFLIGFYRGLHCPFCRRQVLQLAGMQPALQALGVETLAVINTPVDHARLYFRYRPTPVSLLCDPDCATHQAFGLPHIEFLPEGSADQPQWPYRASMAEFMAARINPTGEMAQPTQPMEANAVLNAQDRFEMTEVDQAIFDNHASQLVGHFLVDALGIVRWARIEAADGPNSLCIFPDHSEFVAAARALAG